MSSTIHTDRITLAEQGSAPATPQSGTMELYAGSTGIASCKNDGGTEYSMVPYAEGSWTPAFAGTGTAGSFTYGSERNGRYTRIGNIVHIRAYVVISAISVSPTTNLIITGLPFAAELSTVIYSALAVGYIYNFNLSAGSLGITAYVNPNTTNILLLEYFDDAGAVALPAGALKTTSGIILSGAYQIP